MDKTAVALGLVALVLSLVAYWRSGGQHDMAIARQAIDEQLRVMKTKQDELVENVAATVRSIYQRGQEGMVRARTTLTELRKEAGESLRRQIDRATQQAEKLERRIVEALDAVNDSTIAKARQTQKALVTRVGRMESRVLILDAQWETGRALKLAEKAEFDRAEDRLQEAVARIRGGQGIARR